MSSVSTVGKSLGTLKPFSATQTDSCFINERHDGITLSRHILHNSVFANVSLKNATFEHCDFSHTTFDDCYFRGATFRSCTFVNCRFIDCNFRAATFISCDLKYSRWAGTSVQRATLLDNLPEWPNVSHQLLLELRLNSLSVGEYDDARQYLYRSEELSRDHLWRVVTKHSTYYSKYTFGERFGAFLNCLISWFENVFWGYGEKPFQLIISGAVTVSAFALTYLAYLGEMLPGWATKPVLDQLAYTWNLSAAIFTGAGTLSVEEIVALNTHFGAFAAMETLFGLVFIAFLAAALHRRVSTRRD